MPKDSRGNFHNNIQRAIGADKHLGAPAGKPLGAAPQPGGDGEEGGHTIVPHGDGTFHSVSPEGERTEHPTAGHAAVHFLLRHGEEGKHAHGHSDEYTEHTSHHGETGGQVEGPTEHPDAEALGDHLKSFFSQEAHENKPPPMRGGYGS